MGTPPGHAKVTIIVEVDGETRTTTFPIARNVREEEDYHYPNPIFQNERMPVSFISGHVRLSLLALRDIETEIWKTVEFGKVNEVGLDDKFEASKWWRAVNADGITLAETSTPSDFKNLGLMDVLESDGGHFERLYVKTENSWVKAEPDFFGKSAH